MSITNPIDGQSFTDEDAGRLLGLADEFMEDWEQNEGDGDPECQERRKEYDAIRPLLASAPSLLDALLDAETEIQNMLEDFCQAEGPEADTSAQNTLATIQAAIAKARAA